MESTIHQPYNMSAIFVAHNNAAKMFAQGYGLVINDEATASFFVDTPTGDRYAVNLWNRVSVDALPWCSCPQCEEENICKHIIFAETIANDEGEQIHEGEAREEARRNIANEYLDRLENQYR